MNVYGPEEIRAALETNTAYRACHDLFMESMRTVTDAKRPDVMRQLLQVLILTCKMPKGTFSLLLQEFSLSTQIEGLYAYAVMNCTRRNMSAVYSLEHALGRKPFMIGRQRVFQGMSLSLEKGCRMRIMDFLGGRIQVQTSSTIVSPRERVWILTNKQWRNKQLQEVLKAKDPVLSDVEVALAHATGEDFEPCSLLIKEDQFVPIQLWGLQMTTHELNHPPSTHRYEIAMEQSHSLGVNGLHPILCFERACDAQAHHFMIVDKLNSLNNLNGLDDGLDLGPAWKSFVGELEHFEPINGARGVEVLFRPPTGGDHE